MTGLAATRQESLYSFCPPLSLLSGQVVGTILDSQLYLAVGGLLSLLHEPVRQHDLLADREEVQDSRLVRGDRGPQLEYLVSEVLGERLPDHVAVLGKEVEAAVHFRGHLIVQREDKLFGRTFAILLGIVYDLEALRRRSRSYRDAGLRAFALAHLHHNPSASISAARARQHNVAPHPYDNTHGHSGTIIHSNDAKCTDDYDLRYLADA